MKALTLTFDRKTIIIAILLVTVGVMTFVWRPWEGSRATRTITVIGEADVKATPDEFLFTPYYERTGSDAAKLKTELDTFGNKLLDDVVKLGITKDNITLTSTSYGQASDGGTAATEPAMPGGKSVQPTATLSVTITAPSKELAQKIQNYLGSTDAKGQLTAQAVFSKEKRKELENQARDKATDDAKTKASETAAKLGVSVGKVKEVKDSVRSGSIFPMNASGVAEDSKSSLPVTPGRDSVSVNLEIVFELK